MLHLFPVETRKSFYDHETSQVVSNLSIWIKHFILEKRHYIIIQEMILI